MIFFFFYTPDTEFIFFNLNIFYLCFNFSALEKIIDNDPFLFSKGKNTFILFAYFNKPFGAMISL